MLSCRRVLGDEYLWGITRCVSSSNQACEGCMCDRYTISRVTYLGGSRAGDATKISRSGEYNNFDPASNAPSHREVAGLSPTCTIHHIHAAYRSFVVVCLCSARRRIRGDGVRRCLGRDGKRRGVLLLAEVHPGGKQRPRQNPGRFGGTS